MPDTHAPEGFLPIGQMGFPEHVGTFYRKGDDPGSWIYAMRMAPHHLNRGGVVHGGTLMTFADQAFGETIHEVTKSRCSTISLQVNFVAPGRTGDWVFCEGRITRVTRSVVFISGRVFAGEQTLVDAQGIWKLLSG
jgi:uncharacterized protein (TIGR00369 family)